MIPKGKSETFLKEYISPSHILEDFQGQQWWNGSLSLSAVWASGVLSRQFPHLQVNWPQRECILNLKPITLSSLQL